ESRFQRLRVGHQLLDALPGKSFLNPRYQVSTSEGVQFHASADVVIAMVSVPVAKKGHFFFRGAVVAQIRGRVRFAVDYLFRLQVPFADVRQPQPQVDNLDVAAERVTPRIPLQGADDGEARFIEIVKD